MYFGFFGLHRVFQDNLYYFLIGLRRDQLGGIIAALLNQIIDDLVIGGGSVTAVLLPYHT